MKEFVVSQGTVIRGVRFMVNDPESVFPRVTFYDCRVDCASDQSVLGVVWDVKGVGGHEVVAMLGSEVELRSGSLTVVVELPGRADSRRSNVQAGLLAVEIDGDSPCYFGSRASRNLGRMDVDYLMDLVLGDGGRVGKATEMGQAGSPGEAAVLSVGSEAGKPIVTLMLRSAFYVNVSIHDVKGRLMTTLAEGRLAGGEHVLPWDGRTRDGRAVASGVYLLRVRSESWDSMERKLILVR